MICLPVHDAICSSTQQYEANRISLRRSNAESGSMMTVAVRDFTVVGFSDVAD